jgi:hypothetical protein
MFNSSQTFPFGFAFNKGDIPVTVNAIAINPGVTINLTACCVRTPEAMEKWRMETFSALYQSFLQLQAEYESKMFMAGRTDRITKNPLTLRDEEMLAVKERVLYALNNIHQTTGTNQYTIEKLNFLENAIDWNNIQYRLFQYGPNNDLVALEKEGYFTGVDARRVAFIKALWVQVLIPVLPDEVYERPVLQYFSNDDYDFSSTSNIMEINDDLDTLYQDLLLRREQLQSDAPPAPETEEVRIPTDFIYVEDNIAL